jgi:hypothetical protein
MLDRHEESKLLKSLSDAYLEVSEGAKPFPKEKVEKKIQKKKDEGRDVDAHAMTTAKNMYTKADHWSTYHDDQAKKKQSDHERSVRVYDDVKKKAAGKDPKAFVNAMKNKAEAEKRVKGLKTARNVGRAFDREG